MVHSDLRCLATKALHYAVGFVLGALIGAFVGVFIAGGVANQLGSPDPMTGDVIAFRAIQLPILGLSAAIGAMIVGYYWYTGQQSTRPPMGYVAVCSVALAAGAHLMHAVFEADSPGGGVWWFMARLTALAAIYPVSDVLARGVASLFSRDAGNPRSK